MIEPASLETLLRWRMARAAADGAPAPSAARLLKLARPWWEQWPARWHAAVARLGRVQVAFGHAMTASDARPGGHPVPALVVSEDGDSDAEALARVLYLSLRDGRLRLRFLLPADATRSDADFEATFVGDDDSQRGTSGSEGADRPLLVARAARAATGEYRLDAAVTDDLARRWVALKVTDRMPFRLILRPLPSESSDAT